MTELGVGHQRAVDEEGAADAGADGQQQDRAAHAFAGAVGDLRQAGRIGVVDDQHVAPDGRADLLGAGQPTQPASILAAVVRRPSRTTPGRPQPTGRSAGTSMPASTQPTTVAMVCRDRLRLGRLRRLLAHALAHELGGGQVDERLP